MRKRLTIVGIIIMIIGLSGWLFFVSIPSQSPSMSPEAALGFLVLLPAITLGAILLGVVGIILTILGLVLKGKPKQTIKNMPG